MREPIELWRLRGVRKEVVCMAREVSVSDWDGTLGLELRVECDGDVFLTELFRDGPASLIARSRELRDAARQVSIGITERLVAKRSSSGMGCSCRFCR